MNIRISFAISKFFVKISKAIFAIFEIFCLYGTWDTLWGCGGVDIRIYLSMDYRYIRSSFTSNSFFDVWPA